MTQTSYSQHNPFIETDPRDTARNVACTLAALETCEAQGLSEDGAFGLFLVIRGLGEAARHICDQLGADHENV